MIADFMIYSVCVGAFVALAAWLLDAALGAVGARRRAPWIVAIAATLVLPIVATLLTRPVTHEYAMQYTATPLARNGAASVAATGASPRGPAGGLTTAAWPLESIAGFGWLAMSSALLAVFGFNAWRLKRRARGWPAAPSHADVLVAPDLGPAAFGWRRQRIVFPAWLLDAPPATFDLALRHEREHVAARDPQLLALTTLLVLLLPWNLPLLWMLARLRFAMEIDCDARVLRAGADPAEYGHALLYVSQRQARAPRAALALIERSSQLERRIHVMLNSKRRPLIAAALAALALSCVVAAAQLDAPARVDDVALKPPPSGPDSKLGPIFEREFERRWPGVFDSNAEGSQVIIALVNPDLTITKAARVTSSEKQDDVGQDTGMFRLIGVRPEDAPYMAIMGMESPKHPGRWTAVMYTETKTPGKPFVSHVFQDTRAVDREIARREFPNELRAGVSADVWLWVLIDRKGRVLRKGVEPKNATEPAPSGESAEFIRTHFPGATIAENTWSPLVDEKNVPVRDSAGNEVQLISLWLAKESPVPSN